MTEELRDLGTVLGDEVFPDLDLALRRGRHVDRSDDAQYSFLIEFQAELEAFYRRYGWELVHKSDGFFYLLPMSEKLGRRHLSVGEMLVGQALTLLYLDPSSLEHGGVIAKERVVGQLANTLGPEALLAVFNPKRKRKDDRLAEETVRQRVSEALRKLGSLGFVDVLEEEQLRLRPSLMRFAEPARGAGSPEEALAALAKAGEIVLDPHTSDSAEETSFGEEAADDADSDSPSDSEEVAEFEPLSSRDGPSSAENAEPIENDGEAPR